MNHKQVSQLDKDGYFSGFTTADESPMEPGVFLMPANTVEAIPPQIPAGQRAKFDGKKFILENIPVPEPEVPVPPLSQEEIAALVTRSRAWAYRDESDPIFFKAQRGEATMEEWLAKVEEIKARFPDGVMPS